MKTLTDRFSIRLPSSDTPPEWVHLVPAGNFSGRDGRGPYELDADAVLSAFAGWGIDLVVDYDHQTLTAEKKAGPVPAAGWIKKLELREDGVWGQATWTETAAKALAAKEYRYLSPVFAYDPDTGRVVSLSGAGLTNTPNLYLHAAASQGDPMSKELQERVAHKLGLAPTASAEEILAELDKKKDLLTAAQAAQSAAPDPTKYVPLDQHEAVSRKLAELEGEVKAKAAADAVSAAMSAGKIAPAMEGWAKDYAMADLEGFAKYVEAAPVIASSHSMKRPDGDGHSELSEDDRTAARLLGMSEEAFSQAKKDVQHG
jgi:phage I-like protein